MLINLINNAIKFTNSGFIKITVFRPFNTDNVLEFEVQDTGIGIKPEFIDKL